MRRASQEPRAVEGSRKVRRLASWRLRLRGEPLPLMTSSSPTNARHVTAAEANLKLVPLDSTYADGRSRDGRSSGDRTARRAWP